MLVGLSWWDWGVKTHPNMSDSILWAWVFGGIITRKRAKEQNTSLCPLTESEVTSCHQDLHNIMGCAPILWDKTNTPLNCFCLIFHCKTGKETKVVAICTIVWGKVSDWPALYKLAGLDVQCILGICLTLLLQHWGYKCTPLNIVRGIKRRPLCSLPSWTSHHELLKTKCDLFTNTSA